MGEEEMDRSLQPDDDSIPGRAKAGVGWKKNPVHASCPVACNGKYTLSLVQFGSAVPPSENSIVTNLNLSSAASFLDVLGREKFSLWSSSWQSSSAFEGGGHKDVFLGLCFSLKPLFCTLFFHSPCSLMFCFFFHKTPLKSREKKCW